MPHSSLASPRATIAVLERHGLTTRKRLGQHFLIDDNTVGRILELAALVGSEHVVEVGPGIGTLTEALARHAASVVAVERDERLAPALAEIVERAGNVSVVFADALEVTPEALMAPGGRAPSALVANLPYAVAATIILRFFASLPTLEVATVMVQAEVADRIAAVPGTKDYGAYTVKLALLATVAGRLEVSRGCFLPPPRVDSSVVKLVRRHDTADAIRLSRAMRAAEAAFAERRKTLRNTLASALDAPAASVEAALRDAGVDASVRAETLTPATFIMLGDSLHGYGLLP